MPETTPGDRESVEPTLSVYLVVRSLPGKDDRGNYRTAYYASTEKPKRRSGGITFVGIEVGCDPPAPGEAAPSYGPREPFAQWREMPSVACETHRPRIALSPELVRVLQVAAIETARRLARSEAGAL